jgi:transposase
MPDCTIEELRRQNIELRERLEQLRTLLDNVFEPRMLDFVSPATRSRVVHAMSGAEIGPHLREVALRCQTLARDSADARTARPLEEIGGVLADHASSLEAIFTIPDPMPEP